MQSQSIQPLAQAVLERYEEYKQNRQPLEEKWQANRNAFSGISAASQLEDNDDVTGTNQQEEEKDQFHTVINITRQKVMSMIAILADTVLAGGNIPFILPLDDSSIPDALTAEMMDRRAKMMHDLIVLQHEKTMAERELLRAYLSGGIYGEAWGKKVIEEWPETVWVDEAAEIAGMPVPPEFSRWTRRTIHKKIAAIRLVRVWDMFWDMEATDERDMCGIIQRGWVSPYQLRQMASDPNAIPANIQKALSECAGGASDGDFGQDWGSMPPQLRDIKHRKRGIMVLESWGRFPRPVVEGFMRSLQATTVDGQEHPLSVEQAESLSEGDEIECMVTLAGSHVVKFALTRLDDRPFVRVLCDDDIDQAFGTSVADNIEHIKQALDRVVALYEKNKHLSGRGWTLEREGRIIEKSRTLKPGQRYRVRDEGALNERLEDVMVSMSLPDVGESLTGFIEFLLRLADDESGIPKIIQGLPDVTKDRTTATEISVRTERAQKYMGLLVRNYDSGWIEPDIQWRLDWNLSDPDLQHLAGPYGVRALGFTSFQNRMQRLQQLRDWLTIILGDPELRTYFKVDQIVLEIGKLTDMDVDQFMYSEQERTQKRLDMMRQQIAMAGPEGEGAPQPSGANVMEVMP